MLGPRYGLAIVRGYRCGMNTSVKQDELNGITVWERGWLSCNNVLLQDEESGAVLVDSSHVLHAPQTLALVQAALAQPVLGGQALREVVNTHLHSDHCGGNQTLHQHFGCPLRIPPGAWQAALDWDETQLSYRATGQRCERFVPTAVLAPGDTLAVGLRRWSVLAAPGHDPDSVILFDAQHGVLISADALWENGFGVVFPELEGEQAFDDVGQVLDLIERLDPRTVVPGHGAVFGDVQAALQRARRRLAGFQADPIRHAQHAMKVLVKYHLLEEQQQTWPDFLAWLDTATLTHQVWQRCGHPHGSVRAWAQQVVHELVASGALAMQNGVVHNA